jgi:putative hydrolase of the HAD superfamily
MYLFFIKNITTYGIIYSEQTFIGDKTKKIKTLIFDFGGVLIDLDKERSVKAFSELGIERIDELLSHWCQKGVFLDFEEGKISTENFLTEIKKMTSRAVSSDENKKSIFSILVDLPRYKLDLILKLRNHYQIFLLSNINELIYNYCLMIYFINSINKLKIILIKYIFHFN